MNILGISAFYHDSAAALLVDGRWVAAAQEERFTRLKHDAAFPAQAVAYCLQEAGLTPDQIDFVAFYEKPLLKFDRLLETYLSYAPAGFASFRRAMPVWLGTKLHLKRALRRGLGGRYRGRFVFPEHHESHAASAFFPSPFDEAAILTLDGVGEWATTTFGIGRGSKIELHQEIRFPHSLGLLYSAITYYCGFKVNSGEYKLMGLAPYGEPKFADLITRQMLDLRDDGSFRLNMAYFTYGHGLTMTGRAFEKLMGRPRREPEAPLEPFHLDLAASMQAVTEEIVLRIGRHIHRETGMKRLCLAGGVALNAVANGRLLREGPFDDLWIQPAAGDAGGALGAAAFVWHQLLDHPRTEATAMGSSWLGPCFSQAAINAILDGAGAVYELATDDQDLCTRVAGLIAGGAVVGWFQDRMEFGPRALGARSILADARSADMQRTLNVKIKFRESFRPFAPAVLRERAHEYFQVRPGEDCPYMLMCAPVHPDQRLPPDPADAGRRGLDRLNGRRSTVPAVTHVDGSARLQTVDAGRHGLFHRLLRTFEALTGCPVMINTSFNVRGEPMVCRPEDAYQCFLGTDMDVLVLGRAILRKTSQPTTHRLPREAYLSQFAPD